MEKSKAIWVWIIFWMCLGLALEALHGLKSSFYLDDPVRREMWRLAHAHGVLFGLAYLCFAHFHGFPRPALQKLAVIGMVLLPLGFLLGGIGTHESDPSIGILGAPIGGLCFILGLGLSTAKRS